MCSRQRQRTRTYFLANAVVFAKSRTGSVLIFPRNTVGAVTIKPEDVARLDPGECLNDVLIEFGLKCVDASALGAAPVLM